MTRRDGAAARRSPRADAALVRSVTAQMEALVGPVKYVMHDRSDGPVRISVHVVPPNPRRAYTTLFTTGLSERRMSVPPCGCGGDGYAELMITLPASWSIEPETRGEHLTWPVAWLRDLALYPHASHAWLGSGHTIPNGDPPVPIAPDTALAGVMLLPPRGLGTRHIAHPRGGKIALLALVPLYPGELELKLREGAEALVSRMALYNVSEVVVRRRVDLSRRA